MHYQLEVGTIQINVGGVGKEEGVPFISVVIPADEASKFSAAVKLIAEDYERINEKLKPE